MQLISYHLDIRLSHHCFTSSKVIVKNSQGMISNVFKSIFSLITNTIFQRVFILFNPQYFSKFLLFMSQNHPFGRKEI